MIRNFLYILLNLVVFSSNLISQSLAFTRPPEVGALRDLYQALNYSNALHGWNGSDPCEESWTGVTCSGSSVIRLQIQGLNLTGSLCRLYHLRNLKKLDISSNNIVGEMPFGLPPNVTHMNLSHNFLIGPIGDVFTALDNLKEMDLSYNNFSGDLPSSFGSLANLARLFLQNNRFTGSVTYLAELPLTDLNIQDNLFSGLLPHHFQNIKKLWIGGNKFHAVDNYPPLTSPVGTLSVEHNISRPPTTNTNAIKNYAPPKVREHKHKKKQLGPGGIAFIVAGGTVIATGVALLIAIRLNKLHVQSQNLNYSESSDISFHSHPTSASIEVSSAELDDRPLLLPINVAPLLGPMRFPFLHHNNIEETSRRSYSKRGRSTRRTKIYTIAELQLATNFFNEGNLLGEGSLGPVYKAKFPDGKILAVKIINMAGLSYREEEMFLDVVCTASKLKHPNIIPLNGYCLEHGEHLLVYDYFGNLTLNDALHSGVRETLSWVQRLQIALNVAQALDYLHSACCPPVAHGNLKAANVLLDENLMARVCDSSLAILRPLTKVLVAKVIDKATETTIAERGYATSDRGQTGLSRRRDVFAFGVLLLELLTGRKPFDGARPREEQYLAKWASPRLRDSASLEQIVDPSMKTKLPFKALSCYADLISLCIQPSKQLRPPMSEVVNSLVSFSQKFNFAKTSVADCTDLFEQSLRSADTRFKSSPTFSHLSA
ncbi:unnamed protein product [Lathyrus oleraceus]|uniref:Protein kinase domain-containing protein n=1 Tax=Pisum sativum TaxID=3888 RepID=A0A9D4XVK6_PEA|nr:protein STRUBBELIG-RECEPTOR FAMILY 2-like [Pisum sativum]KAI5426919.1 hypothetical protein KIW84_032376 [Pisum sativum]